MQGIIAFLIAFLKKVDFMMPQINVPKDLPYKFSKHTLLAIISQKPL